MRTRLPIFILILLFAAPASQTAYGLSAAEAASRYNQAGALYREGKFRESLEQYEQLLNGGIAAPDLYYNAANAAYRGNSIGKAVLYLERALRLDPSDPDALANLAFINNIKQDKEPSNDNPVVAFLTRHYSAININAAALWSGISFALAMLCATGILFTAGWGRLAAITSVILFSMHFLLSTGTLIEKVHTRNTVVEAVIMKDAANAYSGPGEENTHIFTAHEGTRVIIERRQDSWNLIRLKSGAGGWIQADAMENI